MSDKPKRPHRNSPLRDMLLGALVIGLVVLAVVWVSGGEKRRAAAGYALTARFEQVDGVAKGTAVFLSGMRIGQVGRIALAAGTLKPELTLVIRPDIRIPVDSAVLIMSDGVLGGKFIKIDPGAEDEMLQDGDAFEHVQGSIILEQILERIVIGAEARRRTTGDGKAPER